MNKPKRFYLDTETRSPLDLKAVGAYQYAHHPDTEVVIFSGCYDDGPPFLIDLTTQELPKHVRERLVSPDYLKIAWNAPFDFLVIKHCLNIPNLRIEQWEDAMAKSLSLSLPASLDKAGEIWTTVLSNPTSANQRRASD